MRFRGFAAGKIEVETEIGAFSVCAADCLASDSIRQHANPLDRNSQILAAKRLIWSDSLTSYPRTAEYNRCRSPKLVISTGANMPNDAAVKNR